MSTRRRPPRDMRAAAWLLERGANLLVVDKFLNHPLTDEQRDLYQQLGRQQPAVSVQRPFGHHRQRARRQAGRRDFDAGAQAARPLRARCACLFSSRWATISRWSRARAARRLTSARSPRLSAAAATAAPPPRSIRETPLWGVYESLVYHLQSSIRPSVTVGQIMSYGAPQTLAPTDTIADAAERMRRYGFEGFPVVEDGRIVGMLTRREIDRALHHGLDRAPGEPLHAHRRGLRNARRPGERAPQGDDRARLGPGAGARSGHRRAPRASSPAPT